MRKIFQLIGCTLFLVTINCSGISNPIEAAPASPLPAQISTSSPTVPGIATKTLPLAVETHSDTGTLRLTGLMLTARATHTATLLPDGSVLIAGGFANGDDSYSDRAERYQPATGKFVETGKMSIRRCCHTATRLLDGRALIAGGFNGDYLSNAEIYDPASGLFTPTDALTTPRMDHTAVLLDDGKVLLVGGVGTGWTFLDSAEIYDPATGSFTPTGGMSVPRESHTLTKLLDGGVLVTGGHQGRHATLQIYASAEIYDPATGAFTPTGSMSVRRHKHDAVRLPDGGVLVTGGSDEQDDLGAYTSAEVYDPVRASFRPVGAMPVIRYKHIGTSLLLHNGKILIAGGARNAVVYDPVGNLFSLVPGDLGTAALSRLFSTATLLDDGSVLIAGGYGLGQPVSASTWIYTP